MDVARYQAAGLYDPADTGAADRLALLEHLEARGVTLEQMIAADAVGSLHAASTDAVLRPGRPMSEDEVAAAVGIPVDLLRRIGLAAGVMFPDGGYRDSDVETFTLFAGRRADVRRGGDAAVHACDRLVDGTRGRRRAVVVPRERRGTTAPAGSTRNAAGGGIGGCRGVARRHPVADGRLLPTAHAGRDQSSAGREPVDRVPRGVPAGGRVRGPGRVHAVHRRRRP